MNIENLASEIKEISIEVLELETKVLENKTDITELEKDREDYKLLVEKEVVFNPDFKNESQRKIAIAEGIKNHEDIRNINLEIFGKESFIKDTEFDIKKLKIMKNFKETMLKLEFLKLEKGI